MTDSLGRSVAFATDSVGRVISVTDPLGNRSTAAYDTRNRLATKTDALAQTETYQYDPARGRLPSSPTARARCGATATTSLGA